MTINVYGTRPLSVENINDGERLAKVDPELYMAQAPSIPFMVYLLNQGIRRIYDWEFKHYTKDWVPDSTQINNGAGYDASTQVLTVDAAARFRPNDTIFNFNTGETMKAIRASSATTLTVGRNVGGTSFTITDDDYLIRISSSFRHGEKPGQFATTQSVEVTSFIQYMEKAVRTNKQNRGVPVVGGDRREHEQAEKQVEFWRELERAFIFNAQPGVYTSGYGYTGLSGSDLAAEASADHPWFMSQSISNFASDHAVTYYSGGARQTITETDWNNFLDAHVHTEAKGRLLPVYVSMAVKQALNYWGREKLEYRPSDIVNGIDCQIYKGNSGNVEIIDCPALSDVVSGVGWNGCLFSFIPGQIMCAGHPDHGMQLDEDVVKDGTEQWVDKWKGAYGFLGINQKYVAWADGISGPNTT